MAFATANIRRGTAGDLKLTAGDWTGSAGDINGTLTIEGGRVYLCRFGSFDTANGPGQEIPSYLSSTSGSVMTISVANRQTVSTGRFIIIHA